MYTINLTQIVPTQNMIYLKSCPTCDENLEKLRIIYTTLYLDMRKHVYEVRVDGQTQYYNCIMCKIGPSRTATINTRERSYYIIDTLNLTIWNSERADNTVVTVLLYRYLEHHQILYRKHARLSYLHNVSLRST